jgi:hypothetical protein
VLSLVDQAGLHIIGDLIHKQVVVSALNWIKASLLYLFIHRLITLIKCDDK